VGQLGSPGAERVLLSPVDRVDRDDLFPPCCFSSTHNTLQNVVTFYGRRAFLLLPVNGVRKFLTSLVLHVLPDYGQQVQFLFTSQENT